MDNRYFNEIYGIKMKRGDFYYKVRTFENRFFWKRLGKMNEIKVQKEMNELINSWRRKFRKKVRHRIQNLNWEIDEGMMTLRERRRFQEMVEVSENESEDDD